MSARVASSILAAALLSVSGAARSISATLDEAQAPTRVVTAAETAVWNLLSPPAKGPKPVVDEIAQKIARLGREAIAPVVGILLGTVVEPESDVAVQPEAVDRREAILIGALQRLPSSAVLEEFRRHVTAETGVDERLLAVHVLGEIGGASALDVILSTASALEPIQWMRTYVQEVIEDSVAHTLQRDASLTKRVGSALAAGDTRFTPILVRALGKAGSPSSLPMLVRALGRDVELDLAIAQELVSIVSSSFGTLSSEDMESVRELLGSSDARLVRGGAAALARLGDEESCGRIVELLSSEDALTVSTAHWGLKLYSGLDLPPDAEAWTRWYERERAWFETALPVLREAIAAQDADRLIAPLNETLTHPLYKHRIAAAIEPLLDSDNATLGRLCCSTLGQLGARSCVPRLIECLSSDDDALRGLAWNALRAITGLRLPADAKSWLAVLMQ